MERSASLRGGKNRICCQIKGAVFFGMKLTYARLRSVQQLSPSALAHASTAHRQSRGGASPGAAAARGRSGLLPLVLQKYSMSSISDTCGTVLFTWLKQKEQPLGRPADPPLTPLQPSHLISACARAHVRACVSVFQLTHTRTNVTIYQPLSFVSSRDATPP